MSEIRPDPFPVHVGPREEFEQIVRSAGFEPRTKMVSGFEEYHLMKQVPTRWFVRHRTSFGRAPGFPMPFAALASPRGAMKPLPARDGILAYPVCREPMERGLEEESVVGPRCSFRGRRRDGVLDLRYVPDGVIRWKQGDTPH
ncbi:MAG TPA: hypothetical protein VK424_03675 [Thermoplasmata archaeon]|nr:hypothetical protein [Thermoplasmata archaeon]